MNKLGLSLVCAISVARLAANTGFTDEASHPSGKVSPRHYGLMAEEIIHMLCCVPLFANVNPGGRPWRPNLIGYDALSACGSPSCFALQMFSRNFGDEILPAERIITLIGGGNEGHVVDEILLFEWSEQQPHCGPIF